MHWNLKLDVHHSLKDYRKLPTPLTSTKRFQKKIFQVPLCPVLSLSSLESINDFYILYIVCMNRANTVCCCFKAPFQVFSKKRHEYFGKFRITCISYCCPLWPPESSPNKVPEFLLGIQINSWNIWNMEILYSPSLVLYLLFCIVLKKVPCLVCSPRVAGVQVSGINEAWRMEAPLSHTSPSNGLHNLLVSFLLGSVHKPLKFLIFYLNATLRIRLKVIVR